jgi:hypothetical protein
MTITAILTPDDATVLELATHARTAGLHLVTNGTRAALVRDIPAGWHRLAVHVKHRPSEAAPCLPSTTCSHTNA